MTNQVYLRFMHVFGYFGQPAGTRQEPMGGVIMAKTRPPPKPAREIPAHGPGWVLVSKPVGGLSSGKPNPRPQWGTRDYPKKQKKLTDHFTLSYAVIFDYLIVLMA